MLPGLGRSWSVPVYVLNGRNTVPGLVCNEDAPPLLNALPHPYELPYYTLMQKARIDELEAQQAQNDAAWNAEIPIEPQAQANGWRTWLVIPPPYTGFSFRRIFEYDGPSLLDGVQQEHNDINNLSDVWCEYSQVEELADNFINGVPAARFAFVRAGGAAVSQLVMADAELLRWIGGMLKRIYTKAIMPNVCPEGAIFPLNPFA